MTQATELSIPFLEKPGVLRLAPYGSELPSFKTDDTKGVFVLTWPVVWLPSIATEPSRSRHEERVVTETIRVSSGPATRTPVEHRWSFGESFGQMADIQDDLRKRAERAGQPFVPGRLMVGWEADDFTSRVIAERAYIDGEDLVIEDRIIARQGSEDHALYTIYVAGRVIYDR